MNTTFRRTRRLLAVTALLLAPLAGCATSTHRTALLDAAPAPATQPATLPAGFLNVKALIIVRHADVDPAMKSQLGDATPLLPAGEQRAKDLAFALKDAGITRIVVSPALRTQETAAVLAKALHITPDVAFARGKPLPEALKNKPDATPIDFVAAISKPTDVVLLVYHHSLIPNMLDQLGYGHESAFAENEYDRAYVILPDPEKHTYRLLRLRYGGKWGAGR